jgi:hypothetical protein
MNPNDDPATRQAEITHEEIAVRAYGLWDERGSPIGSPEEDWFRAEYRRTGFAEIRNYYIEKSRFDERNGGPSWASRRSGVGA